MDRVAISVIVSVIIMSGFVVNDAYGVLTKTVLDSNSYQIVRALSNGQAGSGQDCQFNPSFIGQDTTFSNEKVVSGAPTTGRELCRLVIMVFDISIFPDDAYVVNATFALNVTGSTDTLPASTNNDEGEWDVLEDEEVTNISDQTLWDLVWTNGANESLGTTVFDHSADIFAGIDAQLNSTQTSSTSNFHTTFEDQIESGRDWYNMVNCWNDNSATGCNFSTNQDGSAVAPYDTDDTFLQVWWDTATVATEPLNEIATHSVSPDKCTVDWIVPASDGGRAISGYHIDRRTNHGLWTVLVADTGNTDTDHVDSTITASNSYEYRIFTINPDGESIASGITNSCGIPAISDPPQGLVAFEQPSSDITLDWESPNFDGGLPVDGYFIERDIGTGFETLVADTGDTTTTYIDTEATTNTEHTYRISTINSQGTSTPSSSVSFTIVVVAGGGGNAVDPVPIDPDTDGDGILDINDSCPFEFGVIENDGCPAQIVEGELVESVSSFFEFGIVDVTHDDLVLQSLLSNQRLGIRWSSGQDITITSAVPSVSPFLITFEQFPVIKKGSGAVISTDFILYNLEVPSNMCEDLVIDNCVAKARYEVPVTVNAVLGETNISDVGTITVDLRDEAIDPILVTLLALLGIPVIAGLIQRNRGKSGLPPTGELLRS